MTGGFITGALFFLFMAVAFAILKWNDRRKGIVSKQKYNDFSEFLEQKKTKWFKKLIVPIVLLCFMLIGLISSLVERHLVEKEQSALVGLEESFPENGAQKTFVKWASTRILEFDPQDNREDVYMRIFDKESHALVVEVFLKKGKGANVEIGDGEYLVVSAVGNGPWYGTRRKWGRSTKYKKWTGYLEVGETSGHRWNRTQSNRYPVMTATEVEFNMDPFGR